MVQLLSIGCFGQAMGGGRLAGTWDAVVQIKNCDTGAVQATFASIANLDRGGTSIGSTSGRQQSGRTPEHGIWPHASGNTYKFKFKTFSFAPNGQAIGYSLIEHNVYLNETADSYYSEGESGISCSMVRKLARDAPTRSEREWIPEPVTTRVDLKACSWSAGFTIALPYTYERSTRPMFAENPAKSCNRAGGGLC